MIITEFFLFLKKMGIVGIAIGIVIGAASSTVVGATVQDIINPFVGLFLPSGNLESMTIKVTNLFGHISEFRLGDLISQLINFVIIAFLIFLMYKILLKNKLMDKPPI